MSDPVPYPAPAGRSPRGRPRWIAGVALAAVLGVGLILWAAGWRLPWTGGGRPPASVAPPQAPVAARAVPGQSAPAADLTTLASREATLSGQLAALEARTASVVSTAASASGQASRAENLLIALAARRAIERGAPLGYLEDQLRQRFVTSQPRAAAAVIAASRQPVTLADLREGLDANAADLVTGAAADGVLAGLRRELASLVVIRRLGTPSPRPADRLARARRLLDSGQVEAALGEVERLPGADAATNWRRAAQRYVVVRRALDLVESAAISAPLPMVAPPPPPSAPLPVQPSVAPGSPPPAALP